MRSLAKSYKFSSNPKIFPQNLAMNSSNLMNICLIQCFPAKFSLHFGWDNLLGFQRENPQLISRSNQIRWRQLGMVKLGRLGESRSGMDTLRVSTFFFFFKYIISIVTMRKKDLKIFVENTSSWQLSKLFQNINSSISLN